MAKTRRDPKKSGPQTDFAWLVDEGVKAYQRAQRLPTLEIAQDEISEKIGVGIRTLQAWRRGRTPKEYEVVRDFAKVCIEAEPELGEKWVTKLFRAAKMAGYRDQALKDVFGTSGDHSVTVQAEGKSPEESEGGSRLWVDPRAQGVRPPQVYVERRETLAQLKELLIGEEKVFGRKRVVLWGMGGAGKTVLAQAMALDEKIQPIYYPNGVLWAELGQQGEPRVWLERWCRLLKLPVERDKTVWELHTRVQEALSAPGRHFLIVLDDVWRVGDIEPLLVDGPQSRVLITARERGLASKLDPPVSIVPLEVMTHEEGLTLIRHRAPEHWQEKETNEWAKELLELVERLPLAIALAADVINSRGWHYTIERLRDEALRLGFLEKDKAERREHSTRLAFNVSYKAQPVADQMLFRWLSVFSYSGSFQPLAVANLLSEGQILWMEERLRRLVDRSLLLLSQEGTSEPVRFRLHTLLHDYGRERLRAAGEWDVARKQYVALYLQWAKEWQRTQGSEGHNLEEEWQAEVPNVTQALSYADELGWLNDAALLVDRVGSIARVSGRLRLLDDWLSHLESQGDRLHAAVRSLVLKRRVELAATIRQWDEVIAKGQVAMSDETIDAVSKGHICLHLASAWQHCGDSDAARKAWQQAWQCVKKSNDPYLHAGALRISGDLMFLQGKPQEALQEYVKAEKAYMKLERNQEDLVSLYSRIGEVYFEIRKMDLAFLALRGAMDMSLALGWSPMIFETGYRLVMSAMMIDKIGEAEKVLADLEQVIPKVFDIEPIRSQKMGLFWRLRSMVEHRGRHYKEAVESAEKALVYMEAGDVEDNPLGLTWYVLGESRLAMKDYVPAMQAAQKARELYKQAEAWEGVRQATELIEKAQQGISRGERGPA